MKLRRITLANVRRFVDPVTVGPIPDGVSLFAEENEAGKSTLFDALQALFFLPHRSKAKEVKSLQPYSGGAIAVTCEVEIEGVTWTLSKTWLQKPQATVRRAGAVTHQGDAADAWIAARAGAEPGGPTGLLWLRQGRVSLAAPAKPEELAEQSQRRDLLSTVSGAVEEITGGAQMDRIRDRVTAELDRLQTTRGPRKGGRWAEAEAEVARLQEAAAVLEAQVSDLRQDLEQRRNQQRALAALEEPEALKAQEDALREAEAQLRAGEDQATKLQTAVTEAALSRQHAQSAAEEVARAEAAQAEAAKMAAQREVAETAQAQTIAAAQKAQSAARAARAARDAAQAELRTAEQVLTKRAAQDRAAAMAATRHRLADQLARAEAAEAERLTQLALVAQGPTPETVAELERLAQEHATRAASQAMAGPQVSVAYEPGAETPVRLGGAPLHAGDTRPLPPDGLVEMPGLGTLTIHSGDSVAAEELVQLEGRLRDALAAAGWCDLAAVQAAATTRAEAARNADLAAERRDILAPEGLPDLREKIAALASAGPVEADDADLPSLETAQARREAAQAALVLCETEAVRLAEEAQHAALVAARADEASKAAVVQDSKAQTAARPYRDRDASNDAARIDRLNEAAKAAEAAADRLRAAQPDLKHLRARRDRLHMVREQSRAEVAQLRAEIGKLDGRIETLGEAGVEEALEETRGALAAAQAACARVVFEKDVLIRLRDAVAEAQSAARETYFAPVMAELRPLLSDLWGEAELVWSDQTLLPEALIRDGRREPVELLSGGTQEQIAFFVRLAFARLLAKDGRPAPLILDDALVYSDDDRIARLFDALHAAGETVQILVLSCRARTFRDLGAPRLTFGPANGGV